MTEFGWISHEKQEETGNKERSKLLFNNDTLSDVKFVVRASRHEENDRKRSKIAIPAHKFVLSVCSPVFFRMFCGEMAENKEQIDLPDSEYEGMFEMLRYIYTDEVCLNGSNVMQVLYLAEKYLIPCLVKECVEFLKTNLDASNVLCVLKHAQQYEKKGLMLHCWHLIDRKTKEVLKSDEFVTMGKSFLEQLVARNSLNIQEVELFRAVDRWAGRECARQSLIEEGSVKRQILGEQIVKNIRFPAMKQSDFMEAVSGSKILTQEEIRDIMIYFSFPETSPLGFQEGARVGCYLRCCRSDSTNIFWLKKFTNNSPYITEVTVDRDISLYGVALFGDKDTDYSVTIKLLDEYGSHLAIKTGSFTSSHMVLGREPDSHGYYGFNVLFDVPVALEKDMRYFLGASLEGPSSRVKPWTSHEIDCVDDHRVIATFNFKGLWSEEEELTGQIPELLFKLKD